ncbi:hypothetical protein [Segatella copri]|uniref:hypothetical protein n=1 Tax=Segatella copri TaxID=165179 RepID=UPI001290B246|nr:hypothetical protein [Segatella copri]MQN16892.1 hypothetical protein [Segatella copri]MQN17894.1 hypothetical protein [Segatella copri]
MFYEDTTYIPLPNRIISKNKRNVTYVSKASGKMEKTSPAKTGCNIASVNRQIMGIARDAARVYAATGDDVAACLQGDGFIS